MQTAEYNHEDFTNTAEADKALMVRFYYKSVQNKLESQNQLHPVFKEKLYIEVRVAGQRDVQAARPATYADKMRFPKHLEAFEKRVEPPTEGMPLMEWTKITRSRAEELAFINVKTVEQLASIKDTNIQNIQGGYTLRAQAIQWLATNNAETEDREKEELREIIKTMQARIMALESTPDEEETIEGAAVPVPLAPAAEPKRKSRRAN